MSTESNTNPEAEGMAIYEYIVNHSENCESEMPELIAKLKKADKSGQFLASTARYLAAVDREKYEPRLAPLIEGAIEKDHDRKYIGSLLEAIWGPDYHDRVDELRAKDDNFRRIYRRIYYQGEPM